MQLEWKMLRWFCVRFSDCGRIATPWLRAPGREAWGSHVVVPGRATVSYGV